MSYDLYFDKVGELIQRIKSTQRENLQLAAQRIADSIERGGIIHVFGAGHSHVLAEELFARAGGLGCVNAILEPALMPHSGADKASRLEQIAALGTIVVEDEDIRKEDIMILVSNSGINPIIVEFALCCKKAEIPMIAVTSLEHSTSVPSRHSSGKKLYELADIVLDNQCPKGDALMDIESINAKVAAMSTVTGAAIVQAMVYLTVLELEKRGLPIPVRISRNLHGGERNNLQYRREYASRIRRL